MNILYDFFLNKLIVLLLLLICISICSVFFQKNFLLKIVNIFFVYIAMITFLTYFAFYLKQIEQFLPFVLIVFLNFIAIFFNGLFMIKNLLYYNNNNLNIKR